MNIQSYLHYLLAGKINNFPKVKSILRNVEFHLGLVRHTVAEYIPQLITAKTKTIDIAITANCNLRCIGCRYGRDFMPGSQLDWLIVRNLIDDAKEAGVHQIRLYGGEPLLHPDLPKMVEHCTKRRMGLYVTTNGILLKEKVDELYAAGLRRITMGFYGIGAAYDSYVQRRDRFARLEESIAYIREKYGLNMSLRLNWLLMRPTCSVDALHEAYCFAEKYAVPLQIELIHYSFPYFSEGPDRMLQFRPEDRPQIETVVRELIRLKKARPDMFNSSLLHLSSIPDWLLKGSEMHVPCDKYDFIWVGADGTVQLCYVTFKLGNLHEKRLRDILFTREHHKAARDCFELNCPNCHCGAPSRVQKHLASRRLYSRELVRLSSSSTAKYSEPYNKIDSGL
jgi:cyclic pyranopterin phosphate synthase